MVAGTLGVAAGSIVLAVTASAQGIEVGGQAYVAIKVATWQLTALVLFTQFMGNPFSTAMCFSEVQFRLERHSIQ